MNCYEVLTSVINKTDLYSSRVSVLRLNTGDYRRNRMQSGLAF